MSFPLFILTIPQRVGAYSGDTRGLMLRDTPCESDETLRVDGIFVELPTVGEHTPIYTILGSHSNS